MKQKKILITGVTGFIGQALVSRLLGSNHIIYVVVRRPVELDADINVIVQPLNLNTNWEPLLNDIDIVIHLCGRAHVIKDKQPDPYKAFENINVSLTNQLVSAAAKMGVKRFIFMSTAKVCGEITFDTPFSEASKISPCGDYAKTKAIAENLVQQACASNAMEYVIIRPPLVYGKNVKANFRRLIKISKSKWPLPFGAVNNLRSLIYVENLVDFVIRCILSNKAANQIFFVSDDHDLSTTELLKRLASISGSDARLLPVSDVFLKFVFNCLQPGLYTKLCENLQLDITKAKTLLEWKPPFEIDEGLRKTMSGL